MSAIDPNTFSNLDEIKTKHIHLELKADFQKHILEGYAVLELECLKEDIKCLILDTSYLDIQTIICLETEKELKVKKRGYDWLSIFEKGEVGGGYVPASKGIGNEPEAVVFCSGREQAAPLPPFLDQPPKKPFICAMWAQRSLFKS